MKSNSYSRHNYLKYVSKSLIYRAIGSEKVSLPNIEEYIASIEYGDISGIIDMVKFPEDTDNKEYLLDNAAKLLKLMVQFHIDAAKRSRYQRAAFYCAVVMDICMYLNKKDEFSIYYGKIIQQNNRRPALKDEMKNRIGYN